MEFSTIKEFCFCLSIEEVRNFVFKTKYKDEYIKEFGSVESGKISNSDYEFLCELADILGFSCCSADNEFGLVFYGLEWRDKKIKINNGVLFALPLRKDTLFQKYEDYNDIYGEIYSTFKEIDIILDLEYIREHCGLLEGVEIYD